MPDTSIAGRLVFALCLVCTICSAQVTTKLPGQIAAEQLYPLNPIVFELAKKRMDWETQWHQDVSTELSPLAESAYRASVVLERKVVVDHFQSREFEAMNPNARLNMDIGRHEYLKWACGEALRRANAHMKKTGQKSIKNIVIYNSSIVKDFSRDADLTVYTDDEMSERVFFTFLNAVFTEKRGGYQKGLATTLRGKEGEYGRAISVDDMEVTFHRGTNEPPNVHAPKDLMDFSISYRRGVERQADNPEAYIGFGFEQEVQARRTMQLEVKQPALLAQTFSADETGAVHCKGQYVTNAPEALRILKTTFGPQFSKAHNAMHMFCDFFQASHHQQNPDEQIDKGPLKYSVRATDALCRLLAIDQDASLRRAHPGHHRPAQSEVQRRREKASRTLAERLERDDGGREGCPAQASSLARRDPPEQYDRRMRKIAARSFS